MRTVWKESVESVEEIIISAIEKSVITTHTFHVFGLISVTCGEDATRSATVKLNREVRNVRKAQPDSTCANSVEQIRCNFRKRSNSADSRFTKYIPEASTIAFKQLKPQSPVCLSDKTNNSGNKCLKSNDKVCRKSKDDHNSVDLNIDPEKTFKAIITDPTHKELLEKTLKMCIEMKFHHGSTGFPISGSFLKMLALQARAMGVPVPNDLKSNVSPYQLQRAVDSHKDKGRLTVNAVFSPPSVNPPRSKQAGNLTITKRKRLSFNSQKPSPNFKQGKFAQVMQKKLEEINSVSKNLFRENGHTDKAVNTDGKMKQVISVEKDSLINNTTDDLLNCTLPITESDIKKEKDECESHMIDASFDKKTSDNAALHGDDSIMELNVVIKSEEEGSSVPSNISCIPKNKPDTEFIVTKPCGSINIIHATETSVLSPSIPLPPSSYSFKPIVISPTENRETTQNIKSDTSCDHDSNKEITDQENKEIPASGGEKVTELPPSSNKSNGTYSASKTGISNPSTSVLSCDNKDTFKHSFIPKESLSAVLKVDDCDKADCDGEAENFLNHLPFSDIDNIPDVINCNNNPLNACVPDDLFGDTADKHYNSNSQSTEALKCPLIMNENSNGSVGFDISNECIISPAKLSKFEDVKQSMNSISVDSLKTNEFARNRKHCENVPRETNVIPGNANKNELSPEQTDSQKSNEIPCLSVTVHDHCYAIDRFKQKSNNYSSETVSSTKKCRKAIKTRKYFSLKEYLSKGGSTSELIETEWVSMDDDLLVINDTSFGSLLTSKSNKRKQSGSVSSCNSGRLPAKRAKSDTCISKKDECSSLRDGKVCNRKKSSKKSALSFTNYLVHQENMICNSSLTEIKQQQSSNNIKTIELAAVSDKSVSVSDTNTSSQFTKVQSDADFQTGNQGNQTGKENDCCINKISGKQNGELKRGKIKEFKSIEKSNTELVKNTQIKSTNSVDNKAYERKIKSRESIKNFKDNKLKSKSSSRKTKSSQLGVHDNEKKSHKGDKRKAKSSPQKLGVHDSKKKCQKDVKNPSHDKISAPDSDVKCNDQSRADRIIVSVPLGTYLDWKEILKSQKADKKQAGIKDGENTRRHTVEPEKQDNGHAHSHKEKGNPHQRQDSPPVFHHLLVRPIPTVHSAPCNAVAKAKPKALQSVSDNNLAVPSCEKLNRQSGLNPQLEKMNIVDYNLCSRNEIQSTSSPLGGRTHKKSESTDTNPHFGELSKTPNNNNDLDKEDANSKKRRKKRKDLLTVKKVDLSKLHRNDNGSGKKVVSFELSKEDESLIDKEDLKEKVGKGRLGRKRQQCSQNTSTFKVKSHWLEMWVPETTKGYIDNKKCSESSPKNALPFGSQIPFKWCQNVSSSQSKNAILPVLQNSFGKSSNSPLKKSIKADHSRSPIRSQSRPLSPKKCRRSPLWNPSHPRSPRKSPRSPLRNLNRSRPTARTSTKLNFSLSTAHSGENV